MARRDPSPRHPHHSSSQLTPRRPPQPPRQTVSNRGSLAQGRQRDGLAAHRAAPDGWTAHRQTPAAPTSWDPVASWYQKWVGKEGSEYHRELAIPAAMELLDLQPGERLLDIGCGTGVISGYIPHDVHYTGVDASPRLIAYARSTYGLKRGQRKHGRPIGEARRFLIGDACHLHRTTGLGPGQADAALFLLSIQDMGPLEMVLTGAAWAVKETGRIVIVMLHPCFRVPRQSGWGWDEDRKLQYRRVDSYLSPMVVPVRPVAKGQPGSIKSFHAPLQDYINGLSRHGFYVDRLVEIPAYPGIKRQGPNAKAENRANREIPVFLGLRARRNGGRAQDPV